MSWLLPPLKPHFDAALRDVDAPRDDARGRAAESLGDAPPERLAEAAAALERLVDDRAPTVRAAALASLGRLGAESALDAIVARFEDGDPTVQQVAMIAAADLGDRRALGPIREALGAARAEVRFQAVAALVDLAPEESAEALAPLVDDPDPEVRLQVADALGGLERPEGAESLLMMLGDEEARVQHSAAIGLARLGDGRGVGQLVDALDDQERFFEAAWALGELRADEAREPLARVAESFFKPLATKAAAAAALVRLKDERGVEALRRILRAVRSDARSYAAQLVGELELGALAPEIVRLAKKPRGADLVVVAQTLAKLSPQSRAAAGALADLARRADEVGEVARRLRSP